MDLNDNFVDVRGKLIDVNEKSMDLHGQFTWVMASEEMLVCDSTPWIFR